MLHSVLIPTYQTYCFLSTGVHVKFHCSLPVLADDLIITFSQVLADMVNLPCRIAKGCKYCERELASSCLVRFDNDRYVVFDLSNLQKLMKFLGDI